MASVDTGDGNQFSLNLYPLLDIFSILICFLLMNYSTQGESVESRPNLELPASDIRVSLDTAASVSITKTEIVVQGTLTVPVAIPLVNGDIPDNDKIQGGIKSAYEVFKRVREQNETLKNRNQELGLTESDVTTLTLEADKQTPFLLLKRVMLTAQQADFIAWKLAVQKNDID